MDSDIMMDKQFAAQEILDRLVNEIRQYAFLKPESIYQLQSLGNGQLLSQFALYVLDNPGAESAEEGSSHRVEKPQTDVEAPSLVGAASPGPFLVLDDPSFLDEHFDDDFDARMAANLGLPPEFNGHSFTPVETSTPKRTPAPVAPSGSNSGANGREPMALDGTPPAAPHGPGVTSDAEHSGTGYKNEEQEDGAADSSSYIFSIVDPSAARNHFTGHDMLMRKHSMNVTAAKKTQVDIREARKAELAVGTEKTTSLRKLIVDSKLGRRLVEFVLNQPLGDLVLKRPLTEEEIADLSAAERLLNGWPQMHSELDFQLRCILDVGKACEANNIVYGPKDRKVLSRRYPRFGTGTAIFDGSIVIPDIQVHDDVSGEIKTLSTMSHDFTARVLKMSDYDYQAYSSLGRECLSVRFRPPVDNSEARDEQWDFSDSEESFEQTTSETQARQAQDDEPAPDREPHAHSRPETRPRAKKASTRRKQDTNTVVDKLGIETQMIVQIQTQMVGKKTNFAFGSSHGYLMVAIRDPKHPNRLYISPCMPTYNSSGIDDNSIPGPEIPTKTTEERREEALSDGANIGIYVLFYLIRIASVPDFAKKFLDDYRVQVVDQIEEIWYSNFDPKDPRKPKPPAGTPLATAETGAAYYDSDPRKTRKQPPLQPYPDTENSLLPGPGEGHAIPRASGSKVQQSSDLKGKGRALPEESDDSEDQNSDLEEPPAKRTKHSSNASGSKKPDPKGKGRATSKPNQKNPLVRKPRRFGNLWVSLVSIGYHTVHQIASTPNVLVFMGSRKLAAAEESIARLTPDIHATSSVVPVQLDITDAESIKNAIGRVQEVLKEHSLAGIDVLINNAAVSNPSFESCFTTNVIGTANWTGAIQSSALLNANGTLINVSSTLGSLHWHTERPPPPVFPSYSATKAALNQLTLIWQIEEEQKKSGVRVLSICPGLNETNLNEATKGARSPAIGCKIIVDAALAKEGRAGVFYNEHGDVKW
uniref:Short-chain dehydrogenase/reductase family protein n=1 Tax=Mycena chlorophos TaxID=658473 RepID=A0ABQ0LME2_MYCCL|nr:short-chain dehydrogenase/reductase family protein [Mycena chlorophos]